MQITPSNACRIPAAFIFPEGIVPVVTGSNANTHLLELALVPPIATGLCHYRGFTGHAGILQSPWSSVTHGQHSSGLFVHWTLSV